MVSGYQFSPAFSSTVIGNIRLALHTTETSVRTLTQCPWFASLYLFSHSPISPFLLLWEHKCPVQNTLWAMESTRYSNLVAGLRVWFLSGYSITCPKKPTPENFKKLLQLLIYYLLYLLKYVTVSYLPISAQSSKDSFSNFRFSL